MNSDTAIFFHPTNYKLITLSTEVHQLSERDKTNEERHLLDCKALHTFLRQFELKKKIMRMNNTASIVLEFKFQTRNQFQSRINFEILSISASLVSGRNSTDYSNPRISVQG